MIFIEVDEHSHDGFPISCEISRMTKIVESLKIDGNDLPIRFIRYNPHTYTVNGKKQKTYQKTKHYILIQNIKTCIFNTDFSVKYLFYDEIDNRPASFLDSEYNEQFKQFVI